MRACSVDGCDKPHLARGWCHAHYTQWYRHGNPLATTRHGHKRGNYVSPTYETWRAMKRRLVRPGPYIGVDIDPKWMKFENFLADMGERPAGRTIDRKDNAVGYWKDNCRWATSTEQTRNRRYTRMATVGGQERPLIECAQELGISYYAALYRLNRYGALER